MVKLGARLYRNNVGKLQDKRGQWVAYGLCPGSSDLIGWHTVTISPDMVGSQVAVFVAVEVKTTDRRSQVTDEQERFLQVVTQAGGMAFVARTATEAWEKFKGWHIGK